MCIFYSFFLLLPGRVGPLWGLEAASSASATSDSPGIAQLFRHEWDSDQRPQPLFAPRTQEQLPSGVCSEVPAHTSSWRPLPAGVSHARQWGKYFPPPECGRGAVAVPKLLQVESVPRNRPSGRTDLKKPQRECYVGGDRRGRGQLHPASAGAYTHVQRRGRRGWEGPRGPKEGLQQR